MAYLKVIKGGNAGQTYELHGERTILGRHPNCQIVIENAAVSRQHAQVLESHGSYFLEDLRSRNRTFVNQLPLEGRHELRENDELKVCDVVLRFHVAAPEDGSVVIVADRASGQISGAGAGQVIDDEQDLDRDTIRGDNASIHSIASSLPGVLIEQTPDRPGDKSSIISTLDVKSTSNLRLGIRPEAKLRAVLNITRAVSQTLNLDEVLQKVLDGLFQIFPQADEGFVLLKDAERRKLAVKATRNRSPDGENTVRISMTIVRHALRTGEAILSADAVHDERFDMSESLSGLMIRSMMCVPLMGKSGESLGVVQLDAKDVRNQFSKDDLDILVSVASQASLAVDNARLHRELLRQSEVQKDLDIAMQIQLGFLPHQPPKLDGYEFADHYEAAMRVGGDYFDYIGLTGGRVAIAVGDVAGKGVPAALLMARLYSAARYHLLTQPTPATALTGLNAELASSGLGHRFITCVIVVVEPETNRLVIANAGHLPPMIRSTDGELRTIDRKDAGLPLGILPSQVFQQVELEFNPGDVMLLYTDGITESMNARNEIYGRERLSQFFVAVGEVSADELVQGIVGNVEEFCDGRAQRDDMCLVCARRIPSSHESSVTPAGATTVRKPRTRRKDAT